MRQLTTSAQGSTVPQETIHAEEEGAMARRVAGCLVVSEATTSHRGLSRETWRAVHSDPESLLGDI